MDRLGRFRFPLVFRTPLGVNKSRQREARSIPKQASIGLRRRSFLIQTRSRQRMPGRLALRICAGFVGSLHDFLVAHWDHTATRPERGQPYPRGGWSPEFRRAKLSALLSLCFMG